MPPVTSRSGLGATRISLRSIRATILTVIASAAKQSIEPQESVDCFVALLLAMTIRTGSANGKSSPSREYRRRSMPVRKSLVRDRCARALGLARSFGGEPARAWRGLRHLCRKLAQAFAHHRGQGCHHALRGQGRKNRAQLLRALRHAAILRARAFAAHGEHPARALFRPNRPPAALSRRDRGIAGMGLYRRAAGAAEGISRRGLAAVKKEKAPRS